MADQLKELLSRTALLLRLDAFPGLAAERDADIVDALRILGVRIVADRANLMSPNGQTALVTLVCQCAMLGIRIELDVPDVPQLILQPPLSADLPLGYALSAWTNAMFPGCLSGVDSPLITFAIGSAPTPDAVHVAGNEHAAVLDKTARRVSPWQGDSPYAPIASAAAAAAEVMRAAMPFLATQLDQPLPTDVTWAPRPFSPIYLELPQTAGTTGSLGEIDMVSAGAITHGALYTLLRVPDFDADLRPIDSDMLGVSNGNRYALARAEDLGRPKTVQLAEFATDAVRIVGEQIRLDADTMPTIGQFAPRVLVGVDDIPTRWFVQRQQPAWMGVGATSHAFVVVSDHLHGHPCSGCVHPLDEGDPLDEIPTIGFVSLWAGLLVASTLLAPDRLTRSGTRRIEAHPMGLHGPHALKAMPTSRHPLCPVCGAQSSAA